MSLDTAFGSNVSLDLGFIPSTVADDGDPLDVMVFLDEPSYPGIIVRTRLIGALEAHQTEKTGVRIRNDRLVAIQYNTLLYPDIREVNELPETIRAQVEHFFVSINQKKVSRLRVFKWCGAKHAYKLLDKAVAAYQKKNQQKSA